MFGVISNTMVAVMAQQLTIEISEDPWMDSGGGSPVTTITEENTTIYISEDRCYVTFTNFLHAFCSAM